MNKISLIEKLGILWKVSLSSFWFPIILIILLGLSFFLLQTNPKNQKRNKYIYIGFSLLVVFLLIIIYFPSLSRFFDYFMNHVFIAVLFPNPAIYFLMIVITNIIVWVSLFHYKTVNLVKKINVVVYIIMNYLLALTLKVVNVTNIDVFQEASLFSDKKANALMQLSSSIFVLWIIFLILYRVILVYLRKEFKPRLKKVIVSKKKLPKNFKPIELPAFLSGNVGKKKELKDNTEEFEKMFTVEDYRLLRKLLKEEKEKNEIVEKNKLEEKREKLLKERDRKLEREKIAEMKLQEKLREEEKFTELEMLYRSIK